MTVQMILQVEHARKTGAGGKLLIPASVRPLMVHQPLNAVADAIRICVSASDKAQHGPSRLGRRAGGRREGETVIAGAALAPASVRVLDGAQPFSGPQDVRFPVAFP